MSDSNLREATIRLAHDNPEMRKHLVPLLRKQAAASQAGLPKKDVKGLLSSVEGIINMASKGSKAEGHVKAMLDDLIKRKGVPLQREQTLWLAESILFEAQVSVKWDTQKIQRILDRSTVGNGQIGDS